MRINLKIRKMKTLSIKFRKCFSILQTFLFLKVLSSILKLYILCKIFFLKEETGKEEEEKEEERQGEEEKRERGRRKLF